MLKHLEAALCELGLVSSGQRLQFYVNLTLGEAMSISAFSGAQRFLQIKASQFIDLSREFSTYQRAWADYPDFVPRPHGYCTRGRWQMMISEGIAHDPFSPKLLTKFDEQHIPLLVRDLLRYFESGKKRAPSVHAAHAQLLRTLELHFAATPYVALAKQWIKHALANGVHSVPTVAQHGDFVVNNLAITTSARLAIFDWEDYGQIALQGMDLASLTISAWGADPELIRALAQPHADLPQPLLAFLRRACIASGIEFEHFRILIPLYVLVFLYLKRNYGSNVQRMFGDLLRHLSY
jgi:hypothetical protein